MSIFPKFQNDEQKLKQYFHKLFKITGIINVLIYSSIVIFSHWLVLILYGEDLLYIVPYVQLFAVVTYLRAMGGNIGILVVTTGRTDYDLYWNIITIIILPLVIFIGASISIEWVILLLSITQLILLLPSWYVFFYKLIKFSLKPFLQTHLFPMIIALFIIIPFVKFVNSNILNSILFELLLLVSLFIYSYNTVEEFKLIVKKMKIYDRN